MSSIKESVLITAATTATATVTARGRFLTESGMLAQTKL
jgi:hypothetical protein